MEDQEFLERLEAEMISPDSEDSDAVQVATEIAAHWALNALSSAVNDIETLKSVTIRHAMLDLKILIDGMTKLEDKVLAVVSGQPQDRRPYQLSDKSWAYVLQNSSARKQRKSRVPELESLQGYLESRISKDLKKKLRVKTPAFLTTAALERLEQTGSLVDPDADEDGQPVVAQAYTVCEVIQVALAATFVQGARGGDAVGEAVDDALSRIAERLAILDEKYGIVGCLVHAHLQKLAIVDLSNRMMLFIQPVVKAVGDQIYRDFEWVSGLNNQRPSLDTGAEGFEGGVLVGDGETPP